MKAALGKARRVRKQASHGVALALRIDEPLPQHHVAAAFAVHRLARGEAFKPVFEACGIGERGGMQLRVAAGQPAGIAIFRRSLIG